MARRLPQFDIAKGIAILAVIVGHSEYLGVPSPLVKLAFTFHMPLFFIVSGYFARVDAPLDRAFLRRTARTLLVPYALTCLAMIAIKVLRALAAGDGSVGAELARWVVASLYGAGSAGARLPDGVMPVGAIWFLPALFLGKALLVLVCRVRLAPLLALLCFGLGVCTARVLWLPLSVQAALCAVLFLYVGHLIRRFDLLGEGRMPAAVWPLLALGWVATFALCTFYMVESRYDEGILDVVGSTCATLCVLGLSDAAARRAPRLLEPLERVGQVTLPILCMHVIELNVFPWWRVAELLPATPATWVVLVLLRLLLVAVMVLLLARLPHPLSDPFFPGWRPSVGRIRG